MSENKEGCDSFVVLVKKISTGCREYCRKAGLESEGMMRTLNSDGKENQKLRVKAHANCVSTRFEEISSDGLLVARQQQQQLELLAC